MLATVLKDRFNLDMACLLVCDGWPFVHFIQHGERTMSLRTPTVIQSVNITKMVYVELTTRPDLFRKFYRFKQFKKISTRREIKDKSRKVERSTSVVSRERRLCVYYDQFRGSHTLYIIV